MNPLLANELKSKTFPTNHQTPWYFPLFSPEHGVYMILIVAFMAFQAEHPLTWQIKQRSSLKPRLIVWGSLYGAIALFLVMYLYFQIPLLIWIYLGAIIALMIDMMAVFYRQQRSIINEIITFGAVCLVTPLAYSATFIKFSDRIN